jgi:drug/metabolite transporter (DMT)-like permease
MPAYLPPFGFIVLRVGFAGILFIVSSILFIRERIDFKKDFFKIVICSITGCGANMLLFFKGLSITNPINGAILMACTPVFVVVFAAFLIKEKMSVIRYFGIGIACIGAVLLLGGTHFTFNQTRIWGDVAVAANAIIYSFYLVYAKPLLKKYHPITLSAYTFSIGFLFVLPFGFNEFRETNFSVIPLEIWYYIIFILLGATFLTYLLNAYALRVASASMVGSYIYLQPVLAIIIAVVKNTDTISFEKIAYMLIIFSGVYLVNRTPKEILQTTT